jgi:DNA replication protein DnaC
MPMLVEQTMEKLVEMKLHGMAAALREWMEKPKDQDLSPADLVGLLADSEWVQRENQKLTSRLRNARMKHPACVEDINYANPRGLTKAVMLDLAMSRWVVGKQNVLFTGPTGVGKSYLACALGNKACRDGFHRGIPPGFTALRRTGAGPRRRHLPAAVAAARENPSAHT